MSAGDGQGGVQTGIRIDELLEKMAAPQLIRIAARYAPGEDVRQIVKARDAVARALKQPRALKALIETLTPLERFLLDEVLRSPEGVNGWALLLGARLRGLKPERKPAAVELYRHYRPASFDGAELIWPLLADGLLLPMTLPNPFVASYGYGLDTGSPLLTADERLLSALPPAPERLPVVALTTGAAQATPPQLVKLQLLELLRGVQEAGGLPLTRQGDVNRAAYKRLQKALPALETGETLELWMQVARLDGLLTPDGAALRLAPGAERFGEQDADLWIQRLAVLYPHLMEANEGESANLAHPEALRSALVGLLSQLEQPTTLGELEELLQALTPDELRQPSWRGKPMAWRGWLHGTLNGTLRQLGLVALSAAEGPGQTVAPAPALLHRTASVPSGPAWVVQPNFELVVYPAQLTAAHLEVLRAAQAIRFDHYSASYRLTRESVYTALESGLTLEALLNGLERASAAPLPAGVRSTLAGWAARRERLVLHQNATLLEFPSTQERDAHRASFGGTPIGAALLLPAPERKIAKTLPTLRYDGPPAQVLSATAGGLLKVNGELDFLGRALLSQFARAERGGYALRSPAPGAAIPATLLRDLEARTKGHLPALLRLQLDTWSGTQPPVALASVTLLQHPQAAALLHHPALEKLLEGALDSTLLLVKPGQQQALTLALETLGLTPADGLNIHSSATSAGETGTARRPADYDFPEDTRRKRALLEQAIQEGRRVRLMYQTETYHGWYGESRPGKTRQDSFLPLSVYRQGSAPYLQATRLSDDSEENIRISYVLGIALE